MLAYMLRGRPQTLVVTLVVTLGSVVGCLISYGVGRAAFGLLEPWLLARPGLWAALDAAQARIDEIGALAIGLAMMAPAPVQIAAFAAGVMQINPLVFLLAALAGRSVRYLAMGLLVYFFGPQIILAWRKLPQPVRTGAVTLFVMAFFGVFAWTLAHILFAAVPA